MVSRPVLKMRAALAALAGLAVAGAIVPASSAAAGYVPHRCYVSDLAAGFHGSQARVQGERSVRRRMVTGIARSSARTSSLYSGTMSVST